MRSWNVSVAGLTITLILAIILGVFIVGVVRAATFFTQQPALLGGSQSETTAGQSGQIPESPLEVKLTFLGSPALRQPTQLIISVRSLVDAPEMQVSLQLPQGFELLQGSPQSIISLKAGEKMTLRFTIRAIANGIWEIHVAAQAHQPGAWFMGRDTLYVKVDNEKAVVSNVPFTTSITTSMTTQIPSAAPASPPHALARYTYDTFSGNSIPLGLSIGGILVGSAFFARKRSHANK